MSLDKVGGGGIPESLTGGISRVGTKGIPESFLSVGIPESLSAGIPESFLSGGIPESFGTLATGGVSMASAALIKSASDIVASFEGGAIEVGFLRGSRRVLSGCSFGLVLDKDVLEDAAVLPNKMLEMALGKP